jgi:epoxide hydrolase
MLSVPSAIGSPIANDDIVPFQLHMSDERLAHLRAKLDAADLPRAQCNAESMEDEWSQGMSLSLTRSLLQRWRSGYDWREHESRINKELPQFTTTIDDVTVHFVWRRAADYNDVGALKRTMPLLVSHGWPGSVLECRHVAPLLNAADADGFAFDVVCPSLPGYAFSDEGTSARGFDQLDSARLFSRLMERLGYAQYGVQGGDWGSVVTTLMAAEDPHVLGVHVNMVPAMAPFKRGLLAAIKTALSLAMPSLFFDEREQASVAALPAFAAQELAYMQLHGTKPMTIGVALTDSPIGMAAWIVEKFRTWSDCGGDVLSRFSIDELLTHVTMYYVNDSIASSMRFYWQFFQSDHQLFMSEMDKIVVNVPTAVAELPGEVFVAPRSWASYLYANIVQWNRFESGGHFALLEEPEAMHNDIRQFFKSLL